MGSVDQVWVLGDIVGYGPHPDEVVARLREVGALAVQGNHDAAVLGRIPTGTFNDQARDAVEWTAGTISPATRAWLAAQPDTAGGGRLHAGPRQPARAPLGVPHLHPGGPAQPGCVRDALLPGRATRTCPSPSVTTAARCEVLPAGDGDRLRLDERRCILNPGSVGQPRDGDPRACAMLLDTETREVEWHRVEYPVAETQRAIRALPLPREPGRPAHGRALKPDMGAAVGRGLAVPRKGERLRRDAHDFPGTHVCSSLPPTCAADPHPRAHGRPE